MLIAESVAGSEEAGMELRWLGYWCRAPRCPEHYVVLGAVWGENRWAVLSGGVRGYEEQIEDAVFECGADSVGRITAAFGHPWERLTPAVLMEQSDWSVSAPPLVREMLLAQPRVQLLRLREMVGAAPWKMGEALEMIGVYRQNVGGRHGKGAW